MTAGSASAARSAASYRRQSASLWRDRNGKPTCAAAGFHFQYPSTPYTRLLAEGPELLGPNAAEAPRTTVWVSVKSNEVFRRGARSRSDGCCTGRSSITPPWMSTDSGERKLDVVSPVA